MSEKRINKDYEITLVFPEPKCLCDELPHDVEDYGRRIVKLLDLCGIDCFVARASESEDIR